MYICVRICADPRKSDTLVIYCHKDSNRKLNHDTFVVVSNSICTQLRAGLPKNYTRTYTLGWRSEHLQLHFYDLPPKWRYVYTERQWQARNLRRIIAHNESEREEMGKPFRIMESGPFYQNGAWPQHTTIHAYAQYSFPDERLCLKS